MEERKCNKVPWNKTHHLRPRGGTQSCGMLESIHSHRVKRFCFCSPFSWKTDFWLCPSLSRESTETTVVTERVRRDPVCWWLCGSDIHPGAPPQTHSFALRQAECVCVCVEVGSLPLADEVSSWGFVYVCVCVHLDLCMWACAAPRYSTLD